MGIFLISILVFSFNSAANLAISYDTSVADSALQRFNNNFVKNDIGRRNRNTRHNYNGAFCKGL